MIRDPSDGSVKETTWPQNSQPPSPIAAPSAGKDHAAGAQDVVLATSTSGLPITKAKAEYLARLEESREWLKAYVRPTINGDNEWPTNSIR